MPRIEVYKGNGVMIPISDAKKAKAFQCPWTDKMFSKKASYVSHLKELRETRMHARARSIIKEKIKTDLWNQPSLESIISWFSLHPEFIFGMDKLEQFYSDQARYEKYRETFSMEITYLSLSWSNGCSNTHSRPHNGVTNWDGRKTLADGTPAPRGYPGWTGNIEFKVNCPNSRMSDVLRKLRIHTGTGGSRGPNRYGYDVTIFDADFPELARNTRYTLADNAIQNVRQELKFKYGEALHFKW